MEAVHSCRCCLRRAPDKDLATPYTHLGNTEIYSDMLKQCFDIHGTNHCFPYKYEGHFMPAGQPVKLKLILHSDDKVRICDVCVGRLRDASDFKLQVQHCQEELQVLLQGTLQVKDEERAVKAEASDDEDCISLASPDETTAEAEPAWPVSLRARQQLGMACFVRLKRLRGDEAPHASQTCLATSHHGPGLASRMKDMPGDTSGLRAEEQAYTWDTCGEHFTHKSRLIKHIQEDTPKKISSRKSLKKQHKWVICDVCNKKLADKMVLKVHKRIHTGEKPYACEFCDKRFAQLASLNAHKPKHTGERRYSCNICNKSFTRSHNLRKHEKNHEGKLPFECEKCHKKFKILCYLKSHHKRTHLKVRPYACDKCDKRYLLKYELSLHTRTHTGNRRFSCDVCNKQFSYRKDLRRHEEIHARRAHKATLERHSTMHAEKLYTCDICYKPFSSKSSLIAHTKLHMG